MNNLKFRVWDKKLKLLGDVSSIDFDSKNLMYFYDKETEIYANFEDVELMQSTRLFDENGKEIFEGDIVEFPELYDFYDFEGGLTSVDGFNVASVVKKGNYITLDNFMGKDGTTETELANYECTFDDLDFENFEIIGNIYENKELLENDRENDR